MILKINNGTVRYAADTILENINFEIKNNEKIAVIGRNGCGKTTLLKLIAGMISLDKRDSDEDSYIIMDGHPSIGYLQQMNFEDENCCVGDELLKVFEPLKILEQKLDLLIAKMEHSSDPKLLEDYSKAQIRFETMGGYSYRTDLEIIFTKFGFSLSDLSRPINSFSGGQQTKIAFVKLLLSRPDILILDEPTNHLDMSTIEWLEGYLKSYPKAVIIVSHDRMFLDKVVDEVYEIEYRRMKRYSGNYTSFTRQKQQAFDLQEKGYTAQQKEIERLTKLVEHFKNTPTKVAMTRSKLKQIEHMDRIDSPMKSDLKSFHAKLSPKTESGKDVLKADHLKIGYDTALSEASFEVKKGQKIAVIGENGIGKSTLLKTIIGQVKPLGGTYSYGFQIEPGYFDQQLALYDSEKSVIDDFWDEYPTLTQTEVRTALGNFLFTQDDVFKTVNMLSGGEKVRLCLAKLFQKRPNFLILDEPTNHMDIVGKETLEDILKKYTGTVLCVSHDRYFIKEFANALLVFEPGRLHYYPCGYEEYLKKIQTGLNTILVSPDKNNSNVIMGNQPASPNNLVELNHKANIKITGSNPGKETAKILQRITKLEQMITDIEQNIDVQKQQMNDPVIVCDYNKLCELQDNISSDENKMNQLLEEWTLLNERRKV